MSYRSVRSVITPYPPPLPLVCHLIYNCCNIAPPLRLWLMQNCQPSQYPSFYKYILPQFLHTRIDRPQDSHTMLGSVQFYYFSINRPIAFVQQVGKEFWCFSKSFIFVFFLGANYAKFPPSRLQLFSLFQEQERWWQMAKPSISNRSESFFVSTLFFSVTLVFPAFHPQSTPPSTQRSSLITSKGDILETKKPFFASS